MKIGIDCSPLETQRGGVARYILNILKYFLEISSRHHFVLYFRDIIPEDEILKSYEVKLIECNKIFKLKRILIEQICLAKQIKKDNLDLFFATWYKAPLYMKAKKSVVAAWDISYSTHPKHYKLSQRISLGYFSKWSCKKSTGVITCSPFDAMQIHKFYNIPEEKICTLNLAVDDKFYHDSADPAIKVIKDKYGMKDKTLLSLGFIHNRRNIDVIINAYKQIADNYDDSFLMVIGKNVTNPRIDIEKMLKPLIEKGKANYIEYLPEDEIVAMYRSAWYYICTSTVDGDSILLKEAMRCGTPVVTSNLMYDAVGGNAVIINNTEDHILTKSILKKIFDDDKLRDELSKKSIIWTKDLSWKTVAVDTLNFFEKI